MGVVTGIVQEFQFGMNWSNYSVFVGNIFGAPPAMEGLLAFFAESTFRLAGMVWTGATALRAGRIGPVELGVLVFLAVGGTALFQGLA